MLRSPTPSLEHNSASLELAVRLRARLPDDLVVIQNVDVDLELVAPGEPGFSRRPDLVVVDRAARERVKAERGMLRASEVRIVVEIVSSSTRRTDYVIKRGEYAEAGIPHYWIVDVADPVSPAEFSTIEPCPITVRVDEL